MQKRILLSLIVLLGACSTEKPDTVSIESQDDMKHASSVAANSTENREEVSLSLLEKSDSKYSYKLNGMKFSSNDRVLKKGSVVQSLSESGSGLIKGSFVVIASQLPKGVIEHYEVNEIATSTYRLIPLEIGGDLYELYQALRQNDVFSRVEIEIDYSGKQTSDSF
ncbi:hypothetical protein [Shewanella sp. Isolate7]|uniref:hypothetical protein n=1 Tax=Shewanella sp. Isolate7 TaxID=2908528 RepID=UPI001EFE207F|nr:hypothetical protein [Shewanella sp. Isolate7]MCG9721199.1 hypothetical protein [Shewanella sp. Isolate7]